MRHWRRGRADTPWLEVFQDAYIAVFSAVVLGAMATNVVLNVRGIVSDDCVSAACVQGRTAFPWLACLLLVAGAVAVGRLLGPVSVTPAVGSWLLGSPADRTALVRPRLLRAWVLTVLLVGAVAGLGAALAGFPALEAALVAATTGLVAAAGVGLCAWGQARSERAPRVASLALLGLSWLALALLALGVPLRLPRIPPVDGDWRLPAVVGAFTALALLLVTGRAALAVLPEIRGPRLAAAGALAPSLSGALATLDLALVWDIVHGRHWKDRAIVRPVRGRLRGALALVDRDVARLRRAPGPAAALAACLVVPYVAAALDLGRAILLVAVLTSFVAGIGLFAGLRVISRTPLLARCLPLTGPTTWWACLVVPGMTTLAWSLLAAPALASGLDDGAAPQALVGLLAAVVVALASVSASVRWMTGRAPDYRMPLVSSPAGAIPTSLIGSVVRGPDMVLLVTAPVLLVPTEQGLLVACAVGVLALVVQVQRAP